MWKVLGELIGKGEKISKREDVVWTYRHSYEFSCWGRSEYSQGFALGFIGKWKGFEDWKPLLSSPLLSCVWVLRKSANIAFVWLCESILPFYPLFHFPFPVGISYHLQLFHFLPFLSSLKLLILFTIKCHYVINQRKRRSSKLDRNGRKQSSWS